MPGHDVKMTVGIKRRRKEGEAVYMIPMGMGEKYMAMFQISFINLLTYIPHAGAAIE